MKHLDKQQTANEDTQKTRAKKSQRSYTTISDEQRLRLLILIRDFGLSCYQASKLEQIPYNNAKVIYRAYKNDNVLVPAPRTFKQLALESNVSNRLDNMINAAQLACANNLHDKLPQGFFTQKETEKIYNHNFDVLVIAKTIDTLQRAGHDWLSGFPLTHDNRGR